MTSIDGNPQYHDALGRLVEWKDDSGTTYEVMYAPAGAKIGMMTGQTLAVGRIPLPGGAIASYGPSGLNNYAHADWLGSTRFSSYAATRTMKWDLAHAPYGEVYALTGGGAEFTFTGQFSDYGSTNTLWDFPMREYHSSQGRWISPDPAGLAAVNPMNPQTWNRYAYVGNSPLSNVDPSGLAGRDYWNPRWDRYDAIGSQGGDCFGDPNCSTYEINGMSVSSAAFNGYVLGQGGAGLEFAFDPNSGIGAPSPNNLGAIGNWSFGVVGSLQVGAGVLPVVNDYFFLDVSVYGYTYNPVANSGVFTPVNTWSPEQHPWRMVSTLEKGFSRVTHPLDMLAVNATFFLAGGGSIVAGGAAIAGGCLEPTLAEPLTCGAGILGGVPTMAGGGFLLKQGVTFFHNYTLPAIENWGGDE